jgi:hypothetical protein
MEPDTTNQNPFNIFQMIGAPKEVDPDTSETSSYCSSRNPDSDIEQEQQPKARELNLEMMDENEEGDDRTSTYNKFKSQNEMDLEKALASGPHEVALDDLDELVDFG